MSKNKTLNLMSLGCAKNLVDSEILLGGLNKTDLPLTQNPEEADTIVSEYDEIVKEYQKFIRPLQIPDSSKFKNHFGWKPKKNLNDICDDLLKYWRKY